MDYNAALRQLAHDPQTDENGLSPLFGKSESASTGWPEQPEYDPLEAVKISEEDGPVRDAPLTVDEWVAEREFQQNNPPVEGDYLRTEDGLPIRLEIRREIGLPPFIYARAYVPNRVGCTLSWYARSRDDMAHFGYKCILDPKSVEGIIRRGGLGKDVFLVKELRIIRQSESKASYLVSISEW